MNKKVYIQVVDIYMNECGGCLCCEDMIKVHEN